MASTVDYDKLIRDNPELVEKLSQVSDDTSEHVASDVLPTLISSVTILLVVVLFIGRGIKKRHPSWSRANACDLLITRFLVLAVVVVVSLVMITLVFNPDRNRVIAGAGSGAILAAIFWIWRMSVDQLRGQSTESDRTFAGGLFHGAGRRWLVPALFSASIAFGVAGNFLNDVDSAVLAYGGVAVVFMAAIWIIRFKMIDRLLPVSTTSDELSRRCGKTAGAVIGLPLGTWLTWDFLDSGNSPLIEIVVVCGSAIAGFYAVYSLIRAGFWSLDARGAGATK